MFRRRRESGIVILMVAVFLLFVVGAMAALAIDVVSLYTARSQAQLAADGAALAGARVLANSGMTSKPTDLLLVTNAENLARTIARQVAMSNEVGGRTLLLSEVTVTFNNANPANPRVTVQTGRTDLPTFFARIWGNSALTVSATATAEAYNPSGAATVIPVAPMCVKPWLLPNIDPSSTTPGSRIFDPTTGAIQTTSLLGWTYNTPLPNPGIPMSPACGPTGNCTPPLPFPVAWSYYPGDDATTFPHPTRSLPTCTPPLTSHYQQSIAGCIEAPIACNSTANIDTINYGAVRNSETTDAVNCLTHATSTPGDADQVDFVATPSPPFQFLGGTDNPVAGVATKPVLVSSSLVTVPVFDVLHAPPPPFPSPTNPVTIIGFVQLFLNPDGAETPPPAGNVNATVINMVGCGNTTVTPPILGNGASAVPVRLVTDTP